MDGIRPDGNANGMSPEPDDIFATFFKHNRTPTHPNEASSKSSNMRSLGESATFFVAGKQGK